jgi:hypothetical protein
LGSTRAGFRECCLARERNRWITLNLNCSFHCSWMSWYISWMLVWMPNLRHTTWDGRPMAMMETFGTWPRQNSLFDFAIFYSFGWESGSRLAWEKYCSHW